MKYLGLIFHKDDDSCIAKINVWDRITGDYIYQDKLVDLFVKDKDASAAIPQYEVFILWVTLSYEDADRYDWTVENSGTYNTAAVGPNYALNFNGYVIQEELVKANTSQKVILVDKDRFIEYPFEFDGTIAEYTYEVLKETTKKLYVPTFIGADGVTKVFQIGGETLKCAKFSRFSLDGGITWKYPYDLSINWGSNSSYDDEVISDGIFWIEFIDPPAAGIVIQVDTLPIFDVIRVEIVLNQPSSEDGGYVDYNTPFCLQEYAAEFKV